MWVNSGLPVDWKLSVRAQFAIAFRGLQSTKVCAIGSSFRLQVNGIFIVAIPAVLAILIPARLVKRLVSPTATISLIRNQEEDLRSLLSHFTAFSPMADRNWRYGTKAVPSSWIGVLVKAIQPAGRAKIKAEMRHLPPPWRGAKLLDLGCGNGQFLEWARDMGWQVFGADPDPHAVAIAMGHGIDVRVGGIEQFDEEEPQFDVITLSHVIEHLHDPIAELKSVHRLLKPNGTIWIDTPNLDSIGHADFGSSWRGLEPPRHLVLFTRRSLQFALENTGFRNIRDLPFRPVCAELFAASKAIAEDGNPKNNHRLSFRALLRAKRADRQEAKNPKIREFVTLAARK